MIKKLLIICILSCAFSSLFAQGNIIIDGVAQRADTIEYRQLGPGIYYSHFQVAGLKAYLMEVDLTNPYNEIETFQGKDQVTQLEAMTNAYSRFSWTNHQVIAGINANFWSVPSEGGPAELQGVAKGGSARLHEMITCLNHWNRPHGTTPEELVHDMGYAVIDENNKIWVDDMDFDGVAKIDGVGEFRISQINRLRDSNQLVFFNSYVGNVTKTDDSGTEVFIKPIPGESWKINQDVKCEVTRVVKDKGRNEIKEGESVLSGSGTAQVFLNNLQEGDAVTINMGVFTLKDKLRPLVKEMVSGNALVMIEGELTNRNYNEAYNSRLYPRTAIGASEDGNTAYLIVIDPNPGASTAVVSDILKAAGASAVVSLDGGGSAQMMIGGEIINNPADGKERAVANGWLVISTADEDKVPAKIVIEDYRVVLPKYSQYSPNILVYNQYGVLIEENIEEFELSCDPALGTIKENKIFIANGTATEGELVVTSKGLVVNKKIEILESELSFRLDSVIIDDRHPYSIEVLSTNGTNSRYVEPALLRWESSNNDICEVVEGQLNILSNGTAIIRGEIDDFVGELKVVVEIPEFSKIYVDDFSLPESWVVSGSRNVKELNLISHSFPSGTLEFVYETGRSSSITMEKQIDLYGIPDSIKLIFDPADIPLTSVQMGVKVNTKQYPTYFSYTDIKPNLDNCFLLSKEDIMGTIGLDFIFFPFKLDQIVFYLSPTAPENKKKYSLEIKELSLIYNGYPSIPLSISNNNLINQVEYINPIKENVLKIHTSEEYSRNVKAEIYTVSGSLIDTVNLGQVIGSEITIPLGNLLKGLYIVKLHQNDTINLLRIIVN